MLKSNFTKISLLLVFTCRYTAIFAIIVSLLMPLSFANSMAEASPQTKKEYDIKVAIAFHLINLTQLDSGAPLQPNNIISICIVGDILAYDSFSSLNGTKGDKYEMRVIRKTLSEGFEGCNVLFIGKEQQGLIVSALEQVKGKSILTIGETDMFCYVGGIFNFTVNRGGKIEFEINLKNSSESGIKISSKVLSRARIVGE